MHTFLIRNRDELIERCKAKVARRPHRSATAAQLLRDRDTHDPQLEKFWNQARLEFAFLVHPPNMRFDPLLRERAAGVAKQRLVFGKHR